MHSDSTFSPSLPFSDFQSRRADFQPQGLYGELESFFQGYRSRFPLDLSAANWRKANPAGTFLEWRGKVRSFLLENLHYDPGFVDLQPEVLAVEQRDGYRVEDIAFNTAPWCRVKGSLLRPDGVGPFPAIVALHSWGGPMLLGKDRLVSRGKTHPRLTDFLDKGYGGRFCGDDLAKRGYVVLAIDAFHFGSRLPWGAQVTNTFQELWLPAQVDPLDLSVDEFDKWHNRAKEALFLSLKYLNWAGTTWAGVNFWDDSRCVDYLIAREEVDASRIGCFGQSGGGWRTHFLTALDDRIAASVSSCWLTTGNWGHMYNFSGTIGTFSMLPGVWQRIDLADIVLLAAPRPAMVISGQDDCLFAPEGVDLANRIIEKGYTWAEAPDSYHFHYPPKPHCFDLDNQSAAWKWLDSWLKPRISYA